MRKEKFITVMAIFDKETQKKFEELNELMKCKFGADGKTQGIPYHISLGSYAPEDTEMIVERIRQVAREMKGFPITFEGLQHFGNTVRWMKPRMNEELMNLHLHFDSDYANGYPDWMAHATVFIHKEPAELKLPEAMQEILETMKEARIVGIELGEFFPAKFIVRELFEEETF
ncbi:MAG: hypothetical protein IKK33_02535 [Lachnospiraceae bacterium]|nr:hypothetical protein [Lachnospiraceae bacterium]